MNDTIKSVHGVFSYNIDSVWHVIEPMLDKALKHADGKYTARSVKDALITKSMQMWVAVTEKEIIKAFAITQIINYPDKKVLSIMFAGGVDMKNWLHFIHILQNFGKFHDCLAIEIYGRAGWEKVLAPYGYEKIHSVYRLDIGKTKDEKNMD